MAADTIRAVTFDCYGTLIDWEAGLGSFLYEMQRRRAEPGAALEPGQQLREEWEGIQFAHVRGRYRRYADVLRDSLCDWANERGYRWNERDGAALVRAMESWQPFPDTLPALRRAHAAGLRLAIVSNTDRAIMEHTRRQLAGVELDAIVVAEDAEAYKPDERPFQLAEEQLREDPETILHVAFGFKYDIAPARRQGFRTAWVNRKREPRPGYEQPDFEWGSLWPLAELAESPRSRA